MKKLIGIIAIVGLVIFLTACSGDEEATRTFELEHDGIMTTMVYKFKEDKVIMQTTKNIIQYDLVGFASKDEAKEIFAPMIEQFQNIDGLTHKLEYDDSKAVETLAVDYEVVNFDEIVNLPGMTFSEDPKDKGISMKKSVEILESQGFVEVK